VDDERLGQRIVVALDALPVPAAPATRLRESPSPSRGFAFAPAAIAVIALVVVIIVAAQVLPISRPASQSGRSFSDDFANNQLDQSRWNFSTQGVGPGVAIGEGRMLMTIPANARADQQTGSMGAVIGTRCAARGDYDVQIDWTAVEWPANGGVQITLAENPSGVAVFLDHDIDGGPGIASTTGPAGFKGPPFTDSFGSLRLVRTRGTVVASYKVGGEWIVVGGPMKSSGDAAFNAAISSDTQRFGRIQTRVAFDNFRMTADEMICP
jgi:hypothetical protein